MSLKRQKNVLCWSPWLRLDVLFGIYVQERYCNESKGCWGDPHCCMWVPRFHLEEKMKEKGVDEKKDEQTDWFCAVHFGLLCVWFWFQENSILSSFYSRKLTCIKQWFEVRFDVNFKLIGFSILFLVQAWILLHAFACSSLCFVWAKSSGQRLAILISIPFASKP